MSEAVGDSVIVGKVVRRENTDQCAVMVQAGKVVPGKRSRSTGR